MTCSTCVNGPDATHDSCYCAVAGHRVYHDTAACRFYQAPAPLRTIPMGGWVPCGNARALKCACGSLFVSNNMCQTCGKQVTG